MEEAVLCCDWPIRDQREAYPWEKALEMTVGLNWYVEFIDHCTAGKSAAIFYGFLDPRMIINIKY